MQPHYRELDSSGSEADNQGSHPTGKVRRRLHGSCDRCRKRKGDSAIMPDKTCTNCIQAKTECTHAIPKRKKDRQQEVRELEEQLRLAQETNPMPHKDPEALIKEEGDDFAYVALSEQIQRLDIQRLENKFFRESSMFFLASQAAKVREAFRDETDVPFKKWQHDYAYSEPSSYIFPEPDLADLLFSAYWSRRGRHLADDGFARVVPSCLGCASRYVEDERVLLTDESGYVGPSAGWRFVCQTPLYLRTTIIRGTDITDLQFYALTALYYLGSSCPQTTYHLVSLALGFIVEHGMHRKSPSPPNAKDELEKRVFWVLVTIDRFMSVWLGRPLTLREGDSLSIADDEYWDTEVSDPSHAFVQPARIPSLMTGFRLHIQLGEIADKMLTSLYSNRPATVFNDMSEDQWTEETVVYLDGLLNTWRDTLPLHLRWDPFMPNIHHLNQSTSLHATFYYLRIQIHRPLLSLKTPMALSSQRYSAPLLHNAVLVAAFVLSIGLCGRRASKVPYETGRELEDIEKCLIFLREGERRWYTAGRAVDMVLETRQSSNTKRPREWVPPEFDRRPPAPDGGSLGRRPSGQGMGSSTNFQNVLRASQQECIADPARSVLRAQCSCTLPESRRRHLSLLTKCTSLKLSKRPHLQLHDQHPSIIQPDPGTYAALAGLGFDDNQWERYLAELNHNPFGAP
ncbi:hypothetical protein BKA70DRAFT_1262914 [Coprinopsis sp. MPI-PUGE-AT-0042]|nr:hypothetical protein BKA70DRAFT_1262914 [Coprinopsis sp. MPI-PUGE-AT-0042]